MALKIHLLAIPYVFFCVAVPGLGQVELVWGVGCEQRAALCQCALTHCPLLSPGTCGEGSVILVLQMGH